MLLVPEGQVLTDAQVQAIENHHRIQKLSSTVLVYVD
jgi:hypothetical protein